MKRVKKTKMKRNKLISYCRIATAVTVVALSLIFSVGGVLGAIIKYAVFFIATLIAGFDFEKKSSPAPKGYTLYCLSLTLTFAILLSFIMPSLHTVELSLINVISIVLLAPIFEELFFRGALSGLPYPIISTALIFGVFHGTGFIQATLMGVILAYFYRSSKRLITPIVCHFANNLLALVCTLRDIRIPVLVSALILGVISYKLGVKNEKEVL